VDLARLLSVGLSSLGEADLIKGAQLAEELRVSSVEYSGRILAELHRRGHSWPQIARMTGISQSTCFRRADPFLPPQSEREV
jgi:hypothetical protein